MQRRQTPLLRLAVEERQPLVGPANPLPATVLLLLLLIPSAHGAVQVSGVSGLVLLRGAELLAQAHKDLQAVVLRKRKIGEIRQIRQ